MDQTLISGAYWRNIGWCDFERRKLLKKYISYYSISIRNINDSYMSIEFHIYPSTTWIKKQESIINRDFHNKGYTRYVLKRNRKQSGAVKYATVTHYNDALMKSDELFRGLISLKWVFYNEINKYFGTVLHQKGAIPPSISCYKTNIHYSDESASYFWESVGINKRLGQFEDTSAKLFFSTKISQLIPSYFLSNMNYIVNDKTLTLEPGMSSIDFQIAYRLHDLLHAGILSLSMLDAVNDITVKDISYYRSSLNQIKLKKNKYKKLLKLRYEYERDIDFFIRYAYSERWEYTKKVIEKFYSEVGLEIEPQFKILFQTVKTKQMISENINVLTKDFNEKTSVLHHLAEYKNASKSSKINWVMLFITGLTLILSVFPEFSKQLASIFGNIWIVVKEYVKKF